MEKELKPLMDTDKREEGNERTVSGFSTQYQCLSELICFAYQLNVATFESGSNTTE